MSNLPETPDLAHIIDVPEADRLDLTLDNVTDPNIEIRLGVRASANIVLVDRSDVDIDTPATRNIVVHLGADSSLNLFVGKIGNNDSTDCIAVDFIDNGACFNLKGFALLTDKDRYDLKVRVVHNLPFCRSDQLFKFIVADSARGCFDGLIKVLHGAEGTRAYQNNRNLLASPAATMHTEPQLEIYCDDVECSHGSATGQLDEQALFYMRSRGIELDEARSMLMNAFLSDTIGSIIDKDVRDRITDAVAKKLNN